MFDLAVLTLALTLGPSLASAAIFPKNSQVKMLDPKSFKQAMKTNQTSLVAFVAPWCGHCQRLAPEYNKAAQNLSPLVPVYAIDCDAEENKRLCAEQGVKGFPTLKLFPRGKQGGAINYDGERTAGALFKWTSLRVPNSIKKLGEVKDIESWVTKSKDTNRALLLTEDSKVPLLWKVLGNNFKGKGIELGVHRDKDGDSVKAITGSSLKEHGKKSLVLVYPAGSTDFVVYSGTTKLEVLTKHFNSILDGSADTPVSPSPESPKPKKEKVKSGKKAKKASASPDPVSPEPAAEPSEAPTPDPEPATTKYEQAKTEATEVAQDPLDGEQVVFKTKEKKKRAEKEKRAQDEL